jgi:hypothetical protein
MHARMRVRLCCAAGVVGLIAAGSGPQSASAQNLQSVIRTLDNVLNPDDARRFEEQSRRNHRAEEERYWRGYRAGFDGRGRGRDVGETGRDRGEPRDRFDPTQPR